MFRIPTLSKRFTKSYKRRIGRVKYSTILKEEKKKKENLFSEVEPKRKKNQLLNLRSNENERIEGKTDPFTKVHPSP
jgi:hypothetical protein